MDDVDDFPPEIHKETNEFAFREFGNLTIFPDASKPKDGSRRNLLSVANIYGLTAIGYLEGFHIYLTADLLNACSQGESKPKDPIASVTLRSSPHWLSFSSDNLTLAVCGSGEKGLQASFFDVRNLINKTKTTKTPFAVHILSKSTTDLVVDLHWNPSLENTFYLSVCQLSGEFQILSVKNVVQELAKKPAEFGACSVCWSPRGKQMMIGRKDGSIQQYTPAMEIRRMVPVCEYIDRKVMVSDVLWLSTLQVAVTYVAVTTPEDSQSSLFFATLPPAKETGKSVAWRNFEDPCYGMSGPQVPHFKTSYLDKWNLFVLASSRALETAVIGKSKEGNWDIWNLDDACRALLPMDDDDSGHMPVGTDVILTATERIIIDDTRVSGPMPIYAMLSSEGRISLFHMINQQPAEDYPSLIVNAKVLETEGERPAATLATNKYDGGIPKTTFTPSGKQRLAVKQSLLVKTSTPKLGIGSATDNNTSQFSLTPVQGFGQLQPLEEKRSISPVAKSLSGTFSMLAKQEEPKKAPAVSGSDETSRQTASLPNQATALRPTPAPTLPPPFPTQPLLPSAGSFKLNLAPTSSSVGSASPAQTTASTTNSVPATESGEKLKRKAVVSKTRERINSVQSVDESLADAIRTEVVDFETELTAFFRDCSSTDKAASSLGSDGDKKTMKTKTENLNAFRSEIAKTTDYQHDEIRTARTHCLESFAAFQSLEARQKRLENPTYRAALLSRPLDIVDKRKMKDIRSTFQDLRDAIKQTNAALDEQWHRFVQNPSSLKKTKRRVQMEESNTIHNVISNQMQIIHEQERLIMLLEQELDRLRLLSSTAGLSSPNFYDRTRLAASFNRSATNDTKNDLGSLAESFMSAKTPRNKSGGNVQLNASGPERDPRRVSPQKAQQLSQLLGSRKKTPVRVTPGTKSNIVMPSFQSKAKPRGETPSSAKSDERAVSRTNSTESDVTSNTSDRPLETESWSSSSTPNSEILSQGQPPNTLATTAPPPFKAPLQAMASSFPGFTSSQGAWPFAPAASTAAPSHSIGRASNPQSATPFQVKPGPPVTQAATSFQFKSDPVVVASSNQFQLKTDPQLPATIPATVSASFQFKTDPAPQKNPSTLISALTATQPPAPFAFKSPPQTVAGPTPQGGATGTGPGGFPPIGIAPFSPTGEGVSPQPTSARGSSTISYGGPEKQVSPNKQTITYDAKKNEASSNLNNPPQVVNIKELKEPKVVNSLPFSATFQAKPQVPLGAALEVQKVLNTVVAEKQKTTQIQIQAMSMLPQTQQAPIVTSNDPQPITTAPVQQLPFQLSASLTVKTDKSSAKEDKTPETTPRDDASSIPGEPASPGSLAGDVQSSVTTQPISVEPKSSQSSGIVFSFDKVKKGIAPGLQGLPSRGSASAPALMQLKSESKLEEEEKSPTEENTDAEDSPPAVSSVPPTFTIAPKPQLTRTYSTHTRNDPPLASALVEVKPPPTLGAEKPAAALQPPTTQSEPAVEPPPPPTTKSEASVTSAVVTSSVPTVAKEPGVGQTLVEGSASQTGDKAPDPNDDEEGFEFEETPEPATTTATFGVAASNFSFAAPSTAAPQQGGSVFGGGGGFMGGLGSAPSSNAPSNPFAASVSTATAKKETSSIFGSSISAPFSKQTNVFASPSQGTGSQFGSPSQFGASSMFGAKPTFGSTSQFGSPAAFGQAPAFGSAAAFSSPPGIGAAPTSAGHVFGSSSGGFAAFSSGNNSNGFGALANQGGGGFGAMATQNPVSFGSQAQQPATGFGGFGSATPSGFGASSGGFGSSPGGAFGGDAGNVTSAPQQNKPSFTGWR